MALHMKNVNYYLWKLGLLDKFIKDKNAYNLNIIRICIVICTIFLGILVFVNSKQEKEKQVLNWHVKKFKELKCEEIYKILQIRNKIFIVEQKCAYQDCDDRDKKSYHVYVEDKGEIVSYLRILPRKVSYNEVSIGRVLVNKNYRGKGIAREMMIKAINFIEKNLGEKEIKIQAQCYLINFYKSLGFKEISNEYLEDNIPHIDMLYKKS